MHIGRTLGWCALLSSTLAVTAFTTTAGAHESRADLERILAITGKSFSAPPADRNIIRPAANHAFTVLHNFAGAPNDGDDPTAEVTLDSSGNIYGDTGAGGVNNDGAIFEITPGGTESVLHSFGGMLGDLADGTTPDGAVIFDASGNMYGTTESGGAFSGGTIWELEASGKYKVLHNFDGTDGDFIRGRLVQDTKGNLYGTALDGGANSDGTVFECCAKGELTVLHAFDGADGADPEHGVVSDQAGNLFGVTAFGGIGNFGVVYEITKNGAFSKIYSFSGGDDGGFPFGGLAIDKAGNVYGSTVNGGARNNGTVFKISRHGTLTTLYSFGGGFDGANPEGDMLLAGKDLYGTALYGGYGVGGVFKVTRSGTEKMIRSFTRTKGGFGYSAGVIASGKTLYGTISGGGTDGFGVVFDLKK